MRGILNVIQINERLALLLVLFFISPCTLYAADIVRYSTSTTQYEESDYYLGLLALILKHSTDEFGDYSLEKTSVLMNKQRALSFLQKDVMVDVVWTQTSTLLEHNLAAIKFPLLRGYSGYRIFLIRQQDQDKFNQITEDEQLKRLIAGQASYWPDTEILKSNNYQVLEANTQKSLFLMLLKKRFDYMPRTILEAYREALQYDGLTVEKSIALYYPQTFYFFVNKNNTRLKERMELGFSKIESNGILKKYFENHHDTKRYISFNKDGQRTVFKLNIE